MIFNFLALPLHQYHFLLAADAKVHYNSGHHRTQEIGIESHENWSVDKTLLAEAIVHAYSHDR